MVNYGLAFRKPFTDLKILLIGIILSMIPIVNLIAHGFVYRSSGVGNVKSKENMPEWGDWLNLFVTGFLGFLTIVIYMIPALMVFAAGAGIAIGSIMGAAVIPPEFADQFATGAVSDEVVKALVSNNLPAFASALTTAAPVLLFGVLLVALGLFIIPMAIMSYIKSGKFGDAFALKSIAKRCFTGEYFVVWLVAGIVMILVKKVLIFVPFVGLGAGTFIAGIIGYSLFGQIYQEIKK